MSFLATLGPALLSLDDLAQCSRQIRLHENVTGLRYFTTGQKNAFCIGPLRKDWRARLDVLDSQLVDWEAVGELNSRRHDFSQCPGAKLIEGGDACVQHGRHCCRQWTSGGNHARFSAARHGCLTRTRKRWRLPVSEELTRRFHRRLAHAFHDDDFLSLQFDQNRYFAPK